MARLAKSEVVVVAVCGLQQRVTDVRSSDSGTIDIAVVVIVVTHGLHIIVWEDLIAGAESTAVEAMTLHRDLSGFSILGYQSEVLRSTLTLGASLWLLIDFSGRGSGMIAHRRRTCLLFVHTDVALRSEAAFASCTIAPR